MVHQNDRYRIAVAGLTLLVLLCLLAGHMIVRYELNLGAVGEFLTGSPKLRLRHHNLNLEPRRDVKEITLVFDREVLTARIVLVDDEDELNKTKTRTHHLLSRPSRSISLYKEQIESVKLIDNRFQLMLSEKPNNNIGAPLSIVEIEVNGTARELNKVNKNILNFDGSGEIIHPREVSMLSNTIANSAQSWLLDGIRITLLTMFFTQLVLILVSWKIPANIFSIEYKWTQLTRPSRFDSWCDDYAIPLGFFGTIVSMWIALEVVSLETGGFTHFLGILKTAIFTTVLGMGTKLICMIRQNIAS